MANLDFNQLAPWLNYLAGLAAAVIVGAAVFHVFFFFVLWFWHRRDLSVIAGCLDEFTRDLKHRSVLGRNAPLANQIDAFVEDINDVVTDSSRSSDRAACLQRMHILDERRSYLDSLSFETAINMARTMIEAYPLAGVLGTILAIGSALQKSETAAAGAATAATTMSRIVERFGDAIWSTFAGLAAAILLMFINSLMETRFERLTQCRSHVRDVVAKAKRELAMSVSGRADAEMSEGTTPTVRVTDTASGSAESKS